MNIGILIQLHLFFGQRIPGSPDIHGMWHSTWENDGWSEPEGIITGRKVLDKEGFTSFDPVQAQAAVSQGNVILVTWMTDFGSKGNGVWYSYKELNLPELPIVPLPSTNSIQATPLHPFTEQTTEISQSQNSSSENQISGLVQEPAGNELNLNEIIGISVLPVLLLILIVMFFVRKRVF